MWTGTVCPLPSWPMACTNKWSERVTQQADGMGTSGQCCDRGLTSAVPPRKERAVHTTTSSAVLFRRGANLVTVSQCPGTGEGDSPPGWPGSEEGRARPGLVRRLRRHRALPTAAALGRPQPPAPGSALHGRALTPGSLTCQMLTANHAALATRTTASQAPAPPRGSQRCQPSSPFMQTITTPNSR